MLGASHLCPQGTTVLNFRTTACHTPLPTSCLCRAGFLVVSAIQRQVGFHEFQIQLLSCLHIIKFFAPSDLIQRAARCVEKLGGSP